MKRLYSIIRHVSFLALAFGSLVLLDSAHAQESAPRKVKPVSEKLAKIIDIKFLVGSDDPFSVEYRRDGAEKEPLKVRPGQVLRATFLGKLAPNHYTYSIHDSYVKPKIKVGDGKAFVGLSGTLTESPSPETKKEGDKTKKIFKDTVTWSEDVVVLPATTPGKYVLNATITLQVCDDSICVSGEYLPLSIPVEVAGEALPVSSELQKQIDSASRPTPDVASGPATNNPNGSQQQQGLIGFLVTAFLGAFLMLLTPCVFPMIPITVNYFLKQSEKEHHRPMRMALVYSGTIIIVLSLAILLLGKVIIGLANNAWFNMVLGLVMVYFSLSLFGMYEIELPSFLARFTSSREGQGGNAGAIFMALTFTITSFTCTGPFLGIMLGSIAGARPPDHHLILGSLVYSMTFAAPFFVLALFPSLIRKLPKSGGWMNTVKVTMGFLELAFALKFFGNSDLAWSPGNARFFNFDTVLVAWIVLSIACALYLFGLYRLPHDDPADNIGVVRMLVGALMLGLALHMTPALFGGKLRGAVGENIIAFLPPALKHKDWHLDYIDAWNEAKRDNKLIFIDFTGVNCTNCRDNEENVFPLPAVAAGLKRYVRVQLYTDTVPNPELSAREASLQAERNSLWRDTIADPSNPNYIIFRPDYDTPFEDDLIKGTVLGRRSGTIRNASDFVEFLNSPFQTKVAQGK